MAYETALQERLRHDSEKASDNLDRQERQALSREGDDMGSNGETKPEGAVWTFSFDNAESTDDAVGSNGDIAILLDTGTFIEKEDGTWDAS